MSPERRLRVSNAWRCREKTRYTPEEAAAAFWKYPDKDTGFYLCSCCGWIHAGHEPKYMIEQTVRNIAARRQQRHEASVQRQKSRLVKPAWMSHEIPVRKMDNRRAV